VAKKADLEAAYNRYGVICAEVGRAEQQRDYFAVLQQAETSLSHLRAAIAYQRRYLAVDRPSLPTVDRLLRYAPPLFARRSLDALEAWLGEGKRAERAAYPHLPEQLSAARRAMSLAARLWSEWHVQGPTSLQLSGPDVKAAEAIARVWVTVGAFTRGLSGAVPYTPVTNLRRDAWGKCHGCGHMYRAKIVALLKPLSCPQCKQVCHFVIAKRAV
jgi:hypothetical protein